MAWTALGDKWTAAPDGVGFWYRLEGAEGPDRLEPDWERVVYCHRVPDGLMGWGGEVPAPAALQGRECWFGPLGKHFLKGMPGPALEGWLARLQDVKVAGADRYTLREIQEEREG